VTSPTRWYALGQQCHRCPEKTPWLFIFASVLVVVLVVMLLYKATAMQDDATTATKVSQGILDSTQSTAKRKAPIDAPRDHESTGGASGEMSESVKELVTSVSALSKQLSNLSINIRIVLPHWQLLSTLTELDLQWPEFVKAAGRFVAHLFSFDL